MNRILNMKYFHDLEVFDIPISGVCVKADEFPPIVTEWNRNRYRFYLAEINGRDENKNEIRTYLKMYGKEYEAADFKIGKIYHASRWDAYKGRRCDNYYIVLSNDQESNMEVIQCSTYLKALNEIHALEKGETIVEVDDDDDSN